MNVQLTNGTAEVYRESLKLAMNALERNIPIDQVAAGMLACASGIMNETGTLLRAAAAKNPGIAVAPAGFDRAIKPPGMNGT